MDKDKLIADLQTKVAELEKDLALKIRDRDVFKNFTLAYEERITELEKYVGFKDSGYDILIAHPQTNAEPWGWFNPHNLECGYGTVDWEDTGCIPLFTTPQTKQCKDCGEINPAEIHTCSPQTNAEPVAWQRNDGVIAFFEKPKVDKQGFKWRSLYTTPQTKPLSDEEILQLRHQHRTLLIDGTYRVDELALCRAIEERILGK